MQVIYACPIVSTSRYMRLIVFFDLPTKTKRDIRMYSIFRRYLLNRGYVMMQFSVYSRVCKGLDNVEAQLTYLKSIVPPKGSVRMLQVTEKQYTSMEILVGRMKKEEKNAAEQLLLF